MAATALAATEKATPQRSPAIRASWLSKTYGRGSRAVAALTAVNIEVHRGEIFGLLGPNGAGKTTFVKCALTVCTADAGNVEIFGEPNTHKSVLARVGYLPEGHSFPAYMKAFEVLDHFAALAGVPRAERRKRADALLDRLELLPHRDRRVKGFSKGMAQRLGIANALMADPDLVFFDEPTDGLDPMGRRTVRDLLIELREQGKSVLLNSHLLGEAEQVCDRVGILTSGKIVRIGSVDELRHPTCRYWLDTDDAEGTAKIAREIAEEVSSPANNHPGLLVDLSDREKIVALIDAVRAAGIRLYAVTPMQTSLEDIFVKIVGESQGGKAS